MAYIICVKSITEPQHAIDHKRHVRTLYYCGRPYIRGIGNVTKWSVKAEAERYNTKRDALNTIRRLNTEGAYIKEI